MSIELGKPAVIGEKIIDRRIMLSRPYIIGSVLDYGAGNGDLTVFLPDPKVAWDIDERRRKECAGWGLRVAKEECDTVVSFQVLEHAPVLFDALEDLRRLTRKRLIVSVPNRWWPFDMHAPSPWNRIPFLWWVWPVKTKARVLTNREWIEQIAFFGFTITETFYMKAPMDRAKMFRRFFRSDRTRVPFFATELFIVADR